MEEQVEEVCQDLYARSHADGYLNRDGILDVFEPKRRLLVHKWRVRRAVFRFDGLVLLCVMREALCVLVVASRGIFVTFCLDWLVRDHILLFCMILKSRELAGTGLVRIAQLDFSFREEKVVFVLL